MIGCSNCGDTYFHCSCSNLLEKIKKLEDEIEKLRDQQADWGYEILNKFDSSAADSTDLYTYIKCLVAKHKKLQDELETERMRVVACGVAALANTEKTTKKRIGKDNPYWTASYGDICNAVDREMKLRTRAERAEEALGEAAGAAADEMVDYGKSAQQAVFHAVKAVARKALQQQTIDEEEDRILRV